MLREEDLDKYFSNVEECKYYKDYAPNDGLAYPSCLHSDGIYSGICLLPLKEECYYAPKFWLERTREKIKNENIRNISC